MYGRSKQLIFCYLLMKFGIQFIYSTCYLYFASFFQLSPLSSQTDSGIRAFSNIDALKTGVEAGRTAIPLIK